jgi:hypothetical protein
MLYCCGGSWFEAAFSQVVLLMLLPAGEEVLANRMERGLVRLASSCACRWLEKPAKRVGL